MINLSPKRIFKLLALFVVGLVLASVVGQYIKYHLGYENFFGFVPRFDVNEEVSVPTWYSSVALLFCSMLLGIIAVNKRQASDRYAGHWTGLAAIFLYLSIDEASMLHELIGVNVGTRVADSQPLHYYAWIIPAVILVAILGLVYLKFLGHLPPKTRRYFIAAAALFIGGAIFTEILTGLYWQFLGSNNDFTHSVMTAVEEFLEMMGVVVFIYALMSYMKSHIKEIRISLQEPEKQLK